MVADELVPPCGEIFEAWQAFPSGTFDGTATFSPSPAFNGSSQLYHETGVLTTDRGLRLVADRKFIFRFEAEENKLSVWFVKAGPDHDPDQVDRLYHELEFRRERDRWVARGDHLCDHDMYWSFYDFRLDHAVAALTVWGQKQQVRGPQKDYSSDTVYRRSHQAR